jgi:hypothetical protein
MLTKQMGAVLGVWLVGLGSAVALAAVLNAPYVPRLDSPPAQPTDAVMTVSIVAPAQPQASILLVPPVTIIGHYARAARPVPDEVKPEVSRDISAMTCGPTRELDMGSGHVQVCE